MQLGECVLGWVGREGRVAKQVRLCVTVGEKAGKLGRDLNDGAGN